MTAENIRDRLLRHIELDVDSVPTGHLYSVPGPAVSSTDGATIS
ncbi:MAG: hypothetical protein QGF67_13620 [Lentisphaeria bacterium]|jgi:hypothetical protein|nr:hypothetical protein [Lentisphaeria bacterium]MDP7742475.1 hypothetical protein [Lentisphaeria bacterium]